MGGGPNDDRESWEGYPRLERERLRERAAGKLAQDIGFALPGEDLQELNQLARDDEDRARRGLVELRRGESVWHKHIDELIREDRSARIEAERAWTTWLKSREERMKMERDCYSS